MKIEVSTGVQGGVLKPRFVFRLLGVEGKELEFLNSPCDSRFLVHTDFFFHGNCGSQMCDSEDVVHEKSKE